MGQAAWGKGLEATRFLRWLLLASSLLLACCDGGKRDAVMAQVDGVAIPQSVVSGELRAMLWRRGETWESLDEAARMTRRQEALDRCVEAVLLGSFARPGATLPPKVVQESEAEFQQFLKQFEPPEGWKPRLELQGTGEVPMRGRITAEVVQGNAIEEWLQGQRALGTEHREKQAREWFGRHREELRLPARAKASHVFLTGHDVQKPDRSAEIAELHRRLVAGETTLASLAAKFSEDERSKRNGGDLGWISRDRVPPEFAEQMSTLPLGKPSVPFRTKLGWHIVVVQERRASGLPEFAGVKDEIEARLDQSWREESVKRLVRELREKAKVVMDEAMLQTVEPVP